MSGTDRRTRTNIMSEFNLLGAQRRIFTSTLKPLERLVALAILDFWSRKSGRPFPGVETLTRCTGLSRMAVIRAIKGLEDADAIAVHRMNGKPNLYELGGLMTLEPDQSPRGTGIGERPVSERDRTSLPEVPVPVSERDPKEPKEGTQQGTKGERARKRPKVRLRWTRVPAEWQPSDEHRALARELGVSLDVELAKFRRYTFDKPKKDPDATFQNWLQRAPQFNAPGKQQGPRQPNAGHYRPRVV